MAIFRGDGGAGDSNTDATVTAVTEQATIATTKASEAADSATAAGISAQNAATSATASSTSSAASSTYAGEAASSANAAATSATNAATSATEASSSATAASLAETNAETAETNAETSESNAAASAATATTKATEAATSATSASTSASTATTKASEAATSASNAATSESNAATSATSAATSATASSSSATASATSASAASTSATNASTSATEAATSETNAATSATAAASSATDSANSATTATTQATNAATSASSASASAATATTKASEAATSATNAATSATTATTKASEASTSATNAATSETNAAASFDSFDDRYLGAKATAPTTDNDGDALLTGALYFDTSTESMKVWSGSSWLDAYATLSGALLATNNLSDLNNVTTSRSNLGLGTAAVTDSTAYATAAQGTTADAALPRTGGAMTGAITTNSTFDGRDVSADGTKLDGIEVNATADQTASEIKTAYESNANTNAYTDSEKTKLTGIEANATADQTASEIKSAYESNANTNAFTDADHTKLDGIATNANNYVLPFTDNSTNWNTAYSWGDHGTEGYATQTYVGTQISNLVDSAPATLDTLNELAAALGDDPNFATTVTNSIATKLPLAGGTLTGNLLANHASATPIQITRSSGTNINIKYSSASGTTYVGQGASAGTLRVGTSADLIGTGNEVWHYGNLPTSSVANWNTAYGWGDHASAGYLPSSSYTAADVLTKIKTVDGSGSGLDADLLDGQQGSYYYPASNPNGYTNDQTAAEILTAIKTVDGSGSGLDADLLDGQQGSYYYPASNPNGYTTNTGTVTEGGTTYNGTYPITVRTSANVIHSHPDITFTGATGTLNLTEGNYTTTTTRNKFTTSSGYIELGPMNTSYAHIYTDRPTFYFNKQIRVLGNEVWHTGNDGSGSGLDADLLDGIQATSFLRSDADDTMTGDLLMDSANAEINIKSGAAGTSGAVNWTFNTTGTNYASIKLPYDTRASTGLHIDSGYPITLDATTSINFDISGSEKMRISSAGNLGIGTNNPLAKLTVSNSGAEGIEFFPANFTNGNTIQHYNRSGAAYLTSKTIALDHRFDTSGAERMRISSAGNVGINEANPTYLIHTNSPTPTSGTQNHFKFIGNYGGIEARNFYGNTYLGNPSGGRGIQITFAGIAPGRSDTLASLDNTLDLGFSYSRWDDVYATNGTIQTSDEREKQDIAEINDAEQRVAVAAKGLLRKFRWKESVAEKGDEARTHFGIMAQDLQAAFVAEGLDPSDYAMFIKTEWWVGDKTHPAIPDELDEDGNVIVEGAAEHTEENHTYNNEADAPLNATYHYRLGIRYSELLAFIIAAM